MKCEIIKLSNTNQVLSLQPKGSLAILYAPSNVFLDYAKACQKTFSDIELIGCSTHMNLTKDGFISEALIVFLSDVEISTYCLEDIGTYPILHIQSIEDTIKRLSNCGIDDTICYSLCTFTSHEEMVMSTTQKLLEQHHIDLIGGTAATDSKNLSYILLNDQIKTDACILTFIRNQSGKIKLYKENIFFPTNEWYIATEVDVEKRMIKQLNHMPCKSVMQQIVNSNDLESHFLSHPLGLVLDDDVYIISGKSVQPNGIEYFSNVYRNATLSKMTQGDYRKISEETIKQILSDIPNPSGTLAINCILRTIQFENEHFSKEFAHNLSRLGTFVGFSSFGEQIHYHHCNQTLVLAVFE